MDHQAANRLTGLLYGNILHRNSDETGYQYYSDLLATGATTLPNIICEFYSSEEFVQKFVVNQTPNELARNLLYSFFAPTAVTARDVTELRDALVRNGLARTIRSLVEDTRFFERHGTMGIPRYMEGGEAKSARGGRA